jgi:hypothetical protein
MVHRLRAVVVQLGQVRRRRWRERGIEEEFFISLLKIEWFHGPFVYSPRRLGP